MNRVKFAIYETPANEIQGKQPCARLVSNGTKRMDNICTYINECCSVTSSDIKGVLDALSKYIGLQLSNGYSVELEGLGHFSPSLKTTKKEVKEDGKTLFNVCVDGVNFRCGPELKEMVTDCRPQKVKRENNEKTSRKDRKTQMLLFLKNHQVINISDYAALNRCTYYTANNDIKQFEEEGCLESDGYRTHRIYQLTAAGKEEMDKIPTPSEPLPNPLRMAGKLKL